MPVMGTRARQNRGVAVAFYTRLANQIIVVRQIAEEIHDKKSGFSSRRFREDKPISGIKAPIRRPRRDDAAAMLANPKFLFASSFSLRLLVSA